MGFAPHDRLAENSAPHIAPFAKHRDLQQRWLYIMPAVFITYSLAYVDRSNYGFGAAAGLAETLQITSSQSALLALSFSLDIFSFKFQEQPTPENVLLVA
jgi:hypothetical protein